MSSQVRLVPHLVPVCDVYPGEAPPPQRPKQRFRPYLCTDSVLQVDAKQAGPVACLMRWTTTLPRSARALTQSQRAFATCALEYVVSKPTIADLIHSQNAVLQRLGHEIRGEGGDWSARHMNSHTNKGGSHARSTHGNRGAVVERAVSHAAHDQPARDQDDAD